MAEGSLFPAFFRLFYHTLYSPHVMTIPTKIYFPDETEVTDGVFQTWDDSTVSASVMIQAFVDALLPFVPATTVFDEAIIYTLESSISDPRPRKQLAFGDIGTGAAGTPAAQVTNTFRTNTFSIFKVVLLDVNPTNLWQPIRDISTSPDTEALLAVISDEGYAFNGRNDGRPNSFIQASFTLNENLRKQYRYT